MTRLGRNDPCWCGSGKKFKKCHGGNLPGASPSEADSASRETNPGTPADIDADLARKVKETVLEILQTGRTPAQALELGRSAIFCAEHLVTLFESENPLPRPLACRAGCHFCCYFPVQVTPPEALLLGQFIRQNFSPQEQSELLHRTELFLRLRSGKSKSELAQIRAQLPCPLLQEGKCQAYPVRPLACRAMHALEVRDCERAFRSAAATFGRHYAHRHTFVLSIVQGLREGCRTAACQGETLDLAAALTDLLRQPDLVERWIKGEKAFRGSLPVPHGPWARQ